MAVVQELILELGAGFRALTSEKKTTSSAKDRTEIPRQQFK